MSDPNKLSFRFLTLSGGGGIRGISPAVILDILMKDVNLKLKLPAGTLGVADIFHLAGGTSTGGLLVMMVSGFRMPPEEAVKEYKKLSSKLFSDDNKLNILLHPNGWYSPEPIVEEVKSLLSSQRLPLDMLMEDLETFVGPWNSKSNNIGGRGHATGKHFVTTSLAADINKPIHLRSYQDVATIIQSQVFDAARATSAALPVFESAKIMLGDTEVEAIDAGLALNNPALRVLREAGDIWGHERPIDLLLSLGTGTKPANSVEKARDQLKNRYKQILKRAPKAAVNAATGVDQVHDALTTIFRGTNKYGMIDIDGAGEYGMSDYEAMDTIGSLTTIEMESEEGRTLLSPFTRKCCSSWSRSNPHHPAAQAWLRDPRNAPTPEDLKTTLWSPGNYDVSTFTGVPMAMPIPQRSTNTSGQNSRASAASGSLASATHIPINKRFCGYGDQVTTLTEFFKNPDLPSAFVIYGLPGVGKTELARKFLLSTTVQYTHTFFIDLGHPDREARSLRHIMVRQLKLALPNMSGPELRQDFFNAVESKIENEASWIIVLENVQTATDPFQQYESMLYMKHLLITTRNWELLSHFDPDYGTILLTKLLQDDAVELLSKSMRNNSATSGDVQSSNPSPADKARMTEIVEELFCHPLTIDLAGHLIKKQKATLDNFIEKLSESRGNWFSRTDFMGASNYRQSPYELFGSILRKAMKGPEDVDEDDDTQRARKMMQRFMELLAVLNCEAVHHQLIYRAMSDTDFRDAPIWSETDRALGIRQNYKLEFVPLLPLFDQHDGKWNSNVTMDCVAILRNIGLLLPPDNERTYPAWSMSPLIRLWVLDNMGERQYNRTIDLAAWLVASTISLDAQTGEAFIWRALMRDHVLQLVWRTRKREPSSQLGADILWRFERVCSDCGDLTTAPQLVEAATSGESQDDSGDDIERIITARFRICMNLRKSGDCYRAGRKTEALLQDLQTRGGALDNNTFGKMDFRIRRELANILLQLGKTSEAESIIETMPESIGLIDEDEVEMYLLMLHELQAEAAEDCSAMQAVSEEMQTILGERHPYSIRTKSKTAPLHPTGSSLAVELCRSAYNLSLEVFGEKYAGTIHASVAFARCLINRGTLADLEDAETLLDKDLEADIIARFGAKRPETLELRYQSLVLAYQRTDTRPDERQAAFEELQTIVLIVRKTQGTKHPTTIRMTATMIRFIALKDPDEARRQLATLQEQAIACLRPGHLVLTNLARLQASYAVTTPARRQGLLIRRGAATPSQTTSGRASGMTTSGDQSIATAQRGSTNQSSSAASTSRRPNAITKLVARFRQERPTPAGTSRQSEPELPRQEPRITRTERLTAASSSQRAVPEPIRRNSLSSESGSSPITSPTHRAAPEAQRQASRAFESARSQTTSSSRETAPPAARRERMVPESGRFFVAASSREAAPRRESRASESGRSPVRMRTTLRTAPEPSRRDTGGDETERSAAPSSNRRRDPGPLGRDSRASEPERSAGASSSRRTHPGPSRRHATAPEPKAAATSSSRRPDSSRRESERSTSSRHSRPEAGSDPSTSSRRR